MAAKYRTAPVPSETMPKGIPYIVSNEAAERFSFYGMKCILVIFMTKYLIDANGEDAFFSEDEAKKYYHYFVASAYFFPVLGAIISDAFLGKYRTIIALSIVYCFGHFALAIDETRLGLSVGLALIAIGSGGIKPCVSAHVGDQFGKTNQHLLPRVFSWFYFSINLGSFISTLLIPYLLENVGPWLAFGLPGVLMALATIMFWMGRNTFIHVPPGGLAFVRESFSGEGLRAMLKLSVVYVFIAVFWALWDQTGSSWVLQSEKMDRTWMGVTWLPSQIQAVNPLLILIMIPLFNYVVYPAINRVFPLTPLRKIGIGFFIAAISFCIPALVEGWIVAGETPSISWQLLAFLLITAAEVMVSITGLEFSYTQAPKKMKSMIMALFLLAISAGNLLTALVNDFIINADGSSKMEGPIYFWFFTGLMFVAALLFVGVAAVYQEKTYIQDEATPSPEST